MDGPPPCFSVVVPTRSRAGQLAACLDALARQTYPPASFEVVVVNDGGPTPRDALKEFEGRLSLTLVEQRHSGPAAARNAGARRARGRFLAFTDDDCAPDPGWLSALESCLRQAPGRLVGGRTVNALHDNPYSAASQSFAEYLYEYFDAGRGGAAFFASNNMAVGAEGFRAVGGFDESFNTSEDRDLCDRWLRSGRRMTYAPAAVVRHAHHLTLLSLWRQHYGYGRGAFRFYRARRGRGAAGFTPDPDFYLKLLRRPSADARGPRVILLTALLLWSQTANAFGYLHEYLRAVTGDR